MTHGKFLDSLLNVLFRGKKEVHKASKELFMTGGCAVTCVELDKSNGNIVVHFMNMPIMPKEVRTGHTMSGYDF